MSIIRFIGDLHGKTWDWRQIADQAPEKKSVQVGDFGKGFLGKTEDDAVEDFFHVNPGHRFIRGNHDNPDLCHQSTGHIGDCVVEDKIMYLGGAWSIDYAWRTPGINWWPEEELSQPELDQAINIYKDTKPTIMVTHDCPTSVAYEMFLKEGNLKQFRTRTAEALEEMFEFHQPKIWLFGHWHIDKAIELNGTKFICLGELSYIDIDTKAPIE